MDTIAFLIADELMQQSVYTILHIYKDKLEAHDITTTVTIIDFPHLIDQARSLIRQGAKVIITNSGSHQILTKAIDNVPILCLFSSTNDALYTLRSIAPKYKQIHLLLNENFMFNKEACPEELRKKNRLLSPLQPGQDALRAVSTGPSASGHAGYGHRRLSPAAPDCLSQSHADLFHQAQRIDDALRPALRPGAPGLSKEGQ